MSQSILPMPPQEATKIILKNLPSRRMRDVVEKRFGLRGGGAHTLQAIGKEYKITRERVRQIEYDALKQLRKDEHLQDVAPVFQAIKAHVTAHGGIMTEHELLASLCDSRYHPHVSLLLDIGPSFHRVAESNDYHQRWAVNKDIAHRVEKVLDASVKELEGNKRTVSAEELHGVISRAAKEVHGENVEDHVVQTMLATSKHIHKNPYNEYGLAWWPSINPSGVKDKAYVAITKAAKPLHFREVAEVINKAGWSKKKAHPQTVHNELIKDKRFVLVGRGLYALKEWGYEPGAVRDVIVSVLREARKSLTKDEIVTQATKKRLVKVPTILLNLQNKKLFKHLSDGTYTLV
ncbi:MAG: sigma factor-like helix-turn-helix DNA-binding protein [Patescibacteria group bacterium]